MQGFIELIKKEVYRFTSIWVQTLVGPLTTSLLYQLIFGYQLSTIMTSSGSINYNTFLIPGLIGMQVLLNSFGNGSSSLIQSKYTGNIIYILMAPITPFTIYSAYLISSIIRGMGVGIVIYFGIIWFGDIILPKNIVSLLYFLFFGASITSGFGLIAGILCEKFEQLAGFQSFIIIPFIYLAGVFFNLHGLNSIWQSLAMLNPFMYIVDGFRYGFIAYSNYSVTTLFVLVLVFAITINLIGYLMFKRGINIKR